MILSSSSSSSIIDRYDYTFSQFYAFADLRKYDCLHIQQVAETDLSPPRLDSSTGNCVSRISRMTSAIFCSRAAHRILIRLCKAGETSMVNRFAASTVGCSETH